jgi:hypothetical protein
MLLFVYHISSLQLSNHKLSNLQNHTTTPCMQHNQIGLPKTLNNFYVHDLPNLRSKECRELTETLTTSISYKFYHNLRSKECRELTAGNPEQLSL